jgi:hypothetical protein
MSKHIPDERLEILFTQVQGEFRRGASNDQRTLARQGFVSPIWVTVDARILSPLLDELKQRRRARTTPNKGNANPLVARLAAMEVGEYIISEPISHGNLTDLRRRARKRMINGAAVWERQTLPNGMVRITRMPDGWSYNHKSNPLTGVLAEMKIGDHRDIECNVKDVRAMHDSCKNAARRLMGKPDAQWRSKRIRPTLFRIRRTR